MDGLGYYTQVTIFMSVEMNLVFIIIIIITTIAEQAICP